MVVLLGRVPLFDWIVDDYRAMRSGAWRSGHVFLISRLAVSQLPRES